MSALNRSKNVLAATLLRPLLTPQERYWMFESPPAFRHARAYSLEAVPWRAMSFRCTARGFFCRRRRPGLTYGVPGTSTGPLIRPQYVLSPASHARQGARLRPSLQRTPPRYTCDLGVRSPCLSRSHRLIERDMPLQGRCRNLHSLSICLRHPRPGISLSQRGLVGRSSPQKCAEESRRRNR